MGQTNSESSDSALSCFFFFWKSSVNCALSRTLICATMQANKQSFRPVAEKEVLAMDVHNVMEDAVEDLLNQHWGQLLISCHCDECKNDVLALSLNRLKPHYVRN